MDRQSLPSVVVPVFNASEVLEDCLDSLKSTLDEETQVILIDDASTDPRVLPLLEKTSNAGGPRWRLVRQPRNRGFVATANLGMRLAHGDVVLLNSDTLVTPGWLERLAECLASSAAIATSTPWSNNGEIVSIPSFCESNPVPQAPGRVAQAIAAAVTQLGGPTYPELPTAVGFCMAVSRRAIASVGYFDEDTFGRGYGEENDFSLRCSRQGLRNVLCDDAYVVHHGGRSFEPLGLAPDDASMQRLLKRHPEYLEMVGDFIRRDPLSALRNNICKALAQAGQSFGAGERLA